MKYIGDIPTYEAQAEFVLNLHPTIKARNISIKTFKRFGVEFSAGGSIYIPHHDMVGNVVGLIERTRSGEPKYMFHPSKVRPFPYNLYRNYEILNPFVPVFESPFDVMACPYFSVALIGLQTTDIGMRLLVSLGIPLVIAFDSDRSGQGASYRLATDLIDRSAQVCIVTSGAESMWSMDAARKIETYIPAVQKTGFYLTSL